jgi:hypothetical protein
MKFGADIGQQRRGEKRHHVMAEVRQKKHQDRSCQKRAEPLFFDNEFPFLIIVRRRIDNQPPDKCQRKRCWLRNSPLLSLLKTMMRNERGFSMFLMCFRAPDSPLPHTAFQGVMPEYSCSRSTRCLDRGDHYALHESISIKIARCCSRKLSVNTSLQLTAYRKMDFSPWLRGGFR